MWPESVYPGEVESECPEATEDIDAVLVALKREGPRPAAYRVKTLGAATGGLWQLNLKVAKRQIRLLYAPYGQTIVLFRIHKKSSPQEQERAYELAKTRKQQYDHIRITDRTRHGGSRTLH
jgi:hypothetical protein